MISLFFLGFLLLTVLWNWYYARHWNKNLTVTFRFLQNFVYAGDQAEMTEQIENRKKLVLPILEVSFHVDKKLAFCDFENTIVSDLIYKRDIFALLGNQRITRKLTLNCAHRGHYRINEAYLTSFSLLHGKRLSTEFPADTELYVYAAGTDISDILATCERIMGSVQCAKRIFEDPFAYASIREYTITDPMKTINWKASARTGSLMVNTFESTRMEKIMLFLDVEDSGILKYNYLTEYAISVAASLSRKIIGRGMEVGLFTNISPDSHTCLTPSNSKKQLSDIERLLAGHKTDSDVAPFSSILDSFTGQPEDYILIFISKNTLQNQPAIESFVSQAQPAVWIVPHPAAETCDIHPADHIHLIKRGVYDA